MSAPAAYDAIIIGAGPAGLSAALVLGRCRRRVLVCDQGRQRNASSDELHGFLTRDCTPPRELLAISRDQLKRYDTVELRHAEVVDARRRTRGAEVVLADGTRLIARKLLLATGVVDELPAVEGVEAFYGRSVHHCPYCDGWEHRDEPVAVYGQDQRGLGMTKTLLCWTKDLVLCTDGTDTLTDEDRAFLARHRVELRTERLVRLEGRDGRLTHLVFAGGGRLPRRALFFNTHQRQHAPNLAERLGCEITDKGSIGKHGLEETCVDDVYVAGDASKDVQLAIVAAAEGATAAFAINVALLQDDFR